MCFHHFRVFWRRVGNNSPEKNDTKETFIRINGLKDDLTYELVIKAGNSRGMSTLTEPLKFTTSEKDVMSAASMGKFYYFLTRACLHKYKKSCKYALKNYYAFFKCLSE